MSDDLSVGAAEAFHNMRELFGGVGSGEAEDWVFTNDGVSRRGSESFAESYAARLLAGRKKLPPNHDPRLYFDTPFKKEASSGKEAAGLFFRYFETTSDFFAHPCNVGKLGLLARQFLSHYAGDETLRGLDPGVVGKLGEIEKGILDACPGGRAAMANFLRLMYNRSLGLALGGEGGVSIGASDLGQGGKTLTPLGQVEMLEAKIRMEEIQMARRGQMYCVDEQDGSVYSRGGWTDGEWAEARSRIEAETGKDTDAAAARFKALDGFYFPQKVDYSIGSCYNLARMMRDVVVLHCEERSEFSLGQFLSRLKEHRREPEAHVPDEPDYDMPYNALPPHEEVVPDEGELDAGPETGAESGGGETKTAGEGKKKRKREPKTPKSGALKMAEKFAKDAGVVGGAETELLESIFSRRAGFKPGDYSAESGGFVKGHPAEGIKTLRDWQKESGRARDEEEALKIASGIPAAGSKIGVAVATEGGAFLFSKNDDGSLQGRFVGDEELGGGYSVKKGKLASGDGKGGAFRLVGEISRMPYSPPLKGKAEGEDSKPLPGRGIFGALKRLVRGGIDR